MELGCFRRKVVPGLQEILSLLLETFFFFFGEFSRYEIEVQK